MPCLFPPSPRGEGHARLKVQCDRNSLGKDGREKSGHLTKLGKHLIKRLDWTIVFQVFKKFFSKGNAVLVNIYQAWGFQPYFFPPEILMSLKEFSVLVLNLIHSSIDTYLSWERYNLFLSIFPLHFLLIISVYFGLALLLLWASNGWASRGRQEGSWSSEQNQADHKMSVKWTCRPQASHSDGSQCWALICSS